jgi:hydrogenase expression/formation protein HypE
MNRPFMPPVSPVRRAHPRKLDIRNGTVTLAHGAGGRATAQLVEEIMLAAFSNPALDAADDNAKLAPPPGKLVMSTDSFVVSPLEFPGGDIGSLAVHGTVNDISMSGAIPLYLTCSLIIEEGLPLVTLKRLVDSMAAAARAAGVAIVTGDTKVVERGKGDGLFINTAGVGVIPITQTAAPSCDRAQPGDIILVSGPIGDHGATIMAARGQLPMRAPIETDSAALNHLIQRLLAAAPDVHVLRDPTRGGVAAALNEIAWSSGVGIEVREADIPVRPAVEAACELLGLDPLNLANEGRLIAIVPPEQADSALAAMHADPLGADAAAIGRVTRDPNHFVQLVTTLGGRRMIDWMVGDPLPRIC